MGSITRFIRPETASIVRARLATSMPSPAKESAPRMVMNASEPSDPRTPTRDDDERAPSRAELDAGRGLIEHHGRERRRAVEGGHQGAVPPVPPVPLAQHPDLQLTGPPVPERDPQRERQDDRESKNPEDRLGLAVELPHPREGQLDECVVTHRAAAFATWVRTSSAAIWGIARLRESWRIGIKSSV